MLDVQYSLFLVPEKSVQYRCHLLLEHIFNVYFNKQKLNCTFIVFFFLSQEKLKYTEINQTREHYQNPSDCTFKASPTI